MDKFKKLVKICLDQRVSDMHITGNHPVVLRRDGLVFPQKEIVLDALEVDRIAEKIMEPRHKRALRYRRSIDFSMLAVNNFLRVNIVTTSRGLSISVRLLPGDIPTLEHLNLHPTVGELTKLKSGLLLFCGATGSGKTSTIASMINDINNNRQCHIVTLEDPVEYRFKSKKAFIEQREFGTHFLSFEQGLLDVLRQMPDVIFVGELREPEIMRQTLNVAESGHLVFGTMHAASAEEAMYRIINSFPSDAQELIRYQLSATVQAIITQELMFWEPAGFRVPLCSICLGNQSLKTTIRDNKLALIESMMDLGHGEGMWTTKRYVSEFLEKREHFFPPSMSFRPAKDELVDTWYESPLVDYSAYKTDIAGVPGSMPARREMSPAMQAGDERNGYRPPKYSNKHVEEIEDYIRTMNSLSEE